VKEENTKRWFLMQPFYKKKIKIAKAEKVWKGQSGYLLISEAQLENK